MVKQRQWVTPASISSFLSSSSLLMLRLFTQVITSHVRSGMVCTASTARMARSKPVEVLRSQLWSSRVPSTSMARVLMPAWAISWATARSRVIPLVTSPHMKPRSRMARPQSIRSGRTSGSPPTVFTSTSLGLQCAATSSSTGRKSASGMSGTADTFRQSLPQCRHAMLQRRVHSQNSCRKGCLRLSRSTWSCVASKYCCCSTFMGQQFY